MPDSAPESAPARQPYPLLVHLPEELADEMDALCRHNFMGRTEFIVLALKLYLEKHGLAYVPEPRTARPRRKLSSAAEEVPAPPLPYSSGDDGEEAVLIAADADE